MTIKTLYNGTDTPIQYTFSGQTVLLEPECELEVGQSEFLHATKIFKFLNPDYDEVTEYDIEQPFTQDAYDMPLRTVNKASTKKAIEVEIEKEEPIEVEVIVTDEEAEDSDDDVISLVNASNIKRGTKNKRKK